jgi:hypothetical protein
MAYCMSSRGAASGSYDRRTLQLKALIDCGLVEVGPCQLHVDVAAVRYYLDVHPDGAVGRATAVYPTVASFCRCVCVCVRQRERECVCVVCVCV